MCGDKEVREHLLLTNYYVIVWSEALVLELNRPLNDSTQTKSHDSLISAVQYRLS